MATTESSTGPTPDAAEGTGIRMSLGELPGLADVENPFPEQARATRGGANIYGACSLETFADVGGLSFTHEDAGGFLDYVRQFTAPNFWFQDGSVSIWEYTEPYDDWQDTYGMDAVKVFYHSGHGGMDANGVFSAPLGAAWAGGDTWVNSTQMLLGNERLRYLFWSTCSSLRVLDGQSPILTWANANRGLRMLFGFETTSVDDGTYGQRFWSHWRGGESFSTAWLNASWDISSNQAPSAAACGASAAEAQDRLYNERLFSADPASTAYYSWRWYYSREARAARTQAPQTLAIARLAPPSARSLRDAAGRLGFDPDALRASGAGHVARDGEQTLHVAPDGALSATLATPNPDNRDSLPAAEVRGLAEDAVGRLGLDQDGPLVFDRLMDAYEASGPSTDPEAAESPRITGRVVQYRQVINDTPVITPGAGIVRLAIDNDGTVTHVRSSTRQVSELSGRGEGTVREPAPPGRPRAASGDPARDAARALDERTSRQVLAMAARGSVPVAFGPVPGTREIGYDVDGDRARLVAQQEVEADFGGGIRKRYRVTAPLFA